MNVISNNCLAGRIYQKLGVIYTNPFVWNSIFLTDFIKLVKNYNKINFNNIKLSLSNDSVFGAKNCSTILLDDLIKIYYTHHKQDTKCLKITKTDEENLTTDIFYCDILHYLNKKWFERIKRMNEQPVFIVDDMYIGEQTYTNCDINYFVNAETQYRKIICTTNKGLKKYENTNLKIILKNEEWCNSNELADLILNKIDIKYFNYEH